MPNQDTNEYPDPPSDESNSRPTPLSELLPRCLVELLRDEGTDEPSEDDSADAAKHSIDSDHPNQAATLRPVDTSRPMRPNSGTMGKLSILGFAILMGACSGADDEPEEFDCSVASRSGTYLLTLTAVGGTCGALSPTVVRLDPFGALDPNCVMDKPTTVSPDECSVDSSITCTDEFGTFSFVGTTKQANADGSLVTGIATINIDDEFGPVCTGTYRLRYERQ
jgi:hypothetical protein